MNDSGIANYSSYLTVEPGFTGGNISVDATATGNIVYEVTKNSDDLKLQYTSTAYDSEANEFKNLTYTLAI
jgi:hypothetical protein